MIKFLLSTFGLYIVVQSYRFYNMFSDKEIQRIIDENIDPQDFADQYFKYDKFFNRITVESLEEIKKRDEMQKNQTNHFDYMECINFLELKGRIINKDIIKKQYRTLAKKYHPDISKNNSSEYFNKLTDCKNKLLKEYN